MPLMTLNILGLPTSWALSQRLSLPLSIPPPLPPSNKWQVKSMACCRWVWMPLSCHPLGSYQIWLGTLRAVTREPTVAAFAVPRAPSGFSPWSFLANLSYELSDGTICGHRRKDHNFLCFNRFAVFKSFSTIIKHTLNKSCLWPAKVVAE
jgi:hypothetical protein